MLRTVKATRYVTPLREGGSLPGLVEADDDGLYVVKFRSAGQGTKALVAEVIVGELGRAGGLPVPEIVLVELAEGFGKTEPDPEINDLVTGSAGVNVGLDFLPGALDYSAATPQLIAPELAARVVLFDAYTTNVDRTPRNPNLLVWQASPWLIDHGAALYQHHGTADLPSRACDPFPMIADHVLLALAGDLAAADAWLTNSFTDEVIAATVALMPDALLGQAPVAERDNYASYLTGRLKQPRAFVTEALSAQQRLTANGATDGG